MIRLDLRKSVEKNFDLNGITTDLYYSSSSQKVTFVVLGHFDYLDISEIDNFNDIVNIRPVTKSNGKIFLTHSMILQQIPFSQKRQKKSLFFEKSTEQRISFVVSFKLNYNTCGQISSKDVGILFQKIYDLIEKKLNQYEDINWQLFSCLGSFDIVLVYTTKSVTDDILNIPIKLRSCSIDSKSENLLFDYSISFIAVHEKLDLKAFKETKENKFRATIDISFIPHTMPKTIKKIEELFNDEFKKMNPDSGIPKFSVYSLFGESDYRVFFNDILFSDLLFLHIRKQQVDALFSPEQNYINSFRCTYTYIAFSQRGLDDWSQDKNNQDKNNPRENLLREIESLVSKARKNVSMSMQYTLDTIIQACDFFFNNTYHQVMDNRVGKIFKRALENIHCIDQIHAKHFETQRGISKCLSDISVILRMIPQSEGLYFDHIDRAEFNLTSPMSKLLFAYENLANDLFNETINYVDKKREIFDRPLVFLTVGNSAYIDSRLYFKKRENIGELISINFPDSRFFNPQNCMPYFYHEVGHYLNLHESREHRNKAYDSLVTKYIFLYIQMDLWRIGYENLKISTIKKIYELGEKECTVNLDYTKSFPVFKENWLTKLSEIRTQIFEIGEKNKNQHFIEFAKIMGFLIEESSYLHFFERVVKESRADIIMNTICSYSSQQYLKAIYHYMKVNNIASDEDESFVYRVTIVLLTLNRIDPYKNSIEIEENLHPDIVAFFSPVYPFLHNNDVFFSPMIDYLKDEVKILRNIIQKNNNINNIYEKVVSLPIYSQIETLFQEWYKSIRNWT